MNSFDAANVKLTGRCQNSRKVANHTYLVRRGEDIAVQLHDTDVVTLHPDGSMTLSSGGWRTVTTKARINEHGRIGQKSGIWYMEDGSLFYDGVTVDPDGNVVDPRPATDYELRLKALKKRIRTYAKAFAANVKGIALPSSGDCWGCAFEGNPMGNGHYWQHMEEGYYVPSLLGNAIKSYGYGNPGFIYQLCQTGDWEDTQAMVYKFLLRQLQPELDRELEVIAA